MNGYNDEKRQLDDDAFGAKGSIVSAFDAFRTFFPSFVLQPTHSLPTLHLSMLTHYFPKKQPNQNPNT